MNTFGSYHKDQNTYTFSGEPLSIHSSHFNCHLLKSILDLKQYVNIHDILVNSAQIVAYAQFTEYFEKNPKWDVHQRKDKVAQYFSFCGFGKIDLKNVHPKGGYIETDSEHFGLAWKEIYGAYDGDEDGVAKFTMGFLCGATEAIHDIALGTFDAKQITCLAKGDKSTRIDVFRGLRKKLKPSIGIGDVQVFESQPSSNATSVDYQRIFEVLIADDFGGDEETGLIHKFGSNITRNYTNYVNLIGLKVLMELEKRYQRDGRVKAKSILLQSARISAFNLMGRLISSPEWENTIAPSVNNTVDQIHGILAFINTLGWGKWEIERFNPNGKTTFHITSGSESNCYLKIVGQTKVPICFFMEGMVTAIMNLVHNTRLVPNMKLTQELFDAVFKADNRYIVVGAQTRMMGAETDSFTVSRKS